MPRINVTDEELAALEKLRAKQAHIIGWNAALQTAIDLAKAGAKFGKIPQYELGEMISELEAMKKDLAS